MKIDLRIVYCVLLVLNLGLSYQLCRSVVLMRHASDTMKKLTEVLNTQSATIDKQKAVIDQQQRIIMYYEHR